MSAEYRPGRQATDYPGGGVIFFQGAQVVWRGSGAAANGPPKNIQVCGSLDAAVGKPQPVDMDAMVGANFTGFLPGRPFDILGLQAHYLRLSQVEANFESALQRRVAGPGPAQSRDGFAFEVICFAGQLRHRSPATATRWIHRRLLHDDLAGAGARHQQGALLMGVGVETTCTRCSSRVLAVRAATRASARSRVDGDADATCGSVVPPSDTPQPAVHRFPPATRVKHFASRHQTTMKRMSREGTIQ